MEIAFFVLCGICGLVLLLALLEPVTRRAREELVVLRARRTQVQTALSDTYLSQLKKTLEHAGQQAAEAPEQTPPETAGPPKPDPHSAGYWLRRLAAPLALVGLLGLALEVPIVLFNSDLLADALEYLLGTPGTVIGVITVFGIRIVLTTLHIYGLLISILQMFVAAAYWGIKDSHDTASEAPASAPWARTFTLALLFSLITIEVMLRALLGYGVGGWWKAAFGGTLAFATAGAEVIAGVLIMHHLIIPLVLSLVLMATWPLRLLARLRSRRSAHDSSTVTVPEPVQERRFSQRLLVGLYTVLDCIDTAAMEPLRTVDRSIGKLLESLRALLSRKGDRHATRERRSTT